VRIFKKKEYLYGSFFRQTKGRIEIENELVNVYFFKRRFQLPRYLPDTLTNERYKDQTISLWSHPDSEKDFRIRWRHTYIYDSMGRVINFSYSSCVACSSMPYDYSIIYNSNGQVALITDRTGSTRYKLSYDKEGDVSKFEEYSSDNLVTEITLTR
jgi:hypothetical protein